ncbi:CPBP family intramembrane glutamic endopeptidase [Natrarchaeobius oligotrophus]|uniref:CPBP family intramembrane metalloprotease n=1 Tax=Natrarchaeobius chitinivorans TaxID=1679083 RepID=A0A3N6MMG9_NATCH|nr:type II CAAX endopeptidase family protein [Natrarchaeobius chitinivorans]RQG95646.1 CPBP family intramembrane metalloprotease [Natrarchaeobius chitinivorans]
MTDDRTGDGTAAETSTVSIIASSDKDPEFFEYSNPWQFFAIAFGVSYLFWIPLIVLEYDPFAMPGLILFAAGGLGVPGAAIFLLFWAAEDQHRRDYWRRLVDVRRIGLRWYAVIFLLFPALNGLALLLGVLAGDSVPAFERAAEFAADPISILLYAVFMVVFGPLPEELGWRGYALDGLQARWNAVGASLILGVAWAAWHAPLFLMVGTYQAELGVLTLPFWEFMIGATITSVLYTWIYNNTGRSILGAVLFHFSGNFSGELIPHGTIGRLLPAVFTLLLVIVVVAVYGPKTLTRRSPVQSSGTE